MDKSKFDELLISYLSNELNPEDEEFVLQWINFDGQNRQYFEELSKVWKLLSIKRTTDNIDVTAEWKHFKQTIAKKQQETYLRKEVEGIGNKITENEKRKRGALYKIVVSTAIAVSVGLVIGLTYSLMMNGKPDTQSVTNTKKTDAVTAFVRQEKNISGKPKQLILNDGSEIILWDKSEVSYPEPFATNERTVLLKGRAFFKVIKDNKRPFTVFSGAISTTVLGTRFSVTAFEEANNITVRLVEGNVVVKPVAGHKKTLIDDFYLLPGQELMYSTISSTAKVRTFKVNNINPVSIPNSAKIYHDDPSIPLQEKGSWYMFNNQSLEQVFELLENMYDVEIVYSKREVYNKYFIGKFEKSDSVEVVLKQIAKLNNLNVTKENNKFIIGK